MAVSLSREFLLTAACSVWPPSNSRAEAIRAAAAGPLDWDRFLRIVSRQGVIGLVHDGLTRVRPPVPSGIASEIAMRAEAMAKQNLALAAEAVRLQNLLTQANIPVLFIKGASLSMLAFGNLGLSASQDIDLLVPRETLPATIALLSSAGYRRFNPPLDICDAQLRQLLRLRKGSRLRPPDYPISDRAALAALPKLARHGRGFGHGGVAGRVPQRDGWTANAG